MPLGRPRDCGSARTEVATPPLVAREGSPHTLDRPTWATPRPSRPGTDARIEDGDPRGVHLPVERFSLDGQQIFREVAPGVWVAEQHEGFPAVPSSAGDSISATLCFARGLKDSVGQKRLDACVP